MNVIMPTAMTSMHQDEKLAQSSAQTAKRGIKVLKSLMNKPGMKEQCQVIYDVSIGRNDDDSKDYKVRVVLFLILYFVYYKIDYRFGTYILSSFLLVMLHHIVILTTKCIFNKMNDSIGLNFLKSGDTKRNKEKILKIL